MGEHPFAAQPTTVPHNTWHLGSVGGRWRSRRPPCACEHQGACAGEHPLGGPRPPDYPPPPDDPPPEDDDGWPPRPHPTSWSAWRAHAIRTRWCFSADNDADSDIDNDADSGADSDADTDADSGTDSGPYPDDDNQFSFVTSPPLTVQVSLSLNRKVGVGPMGAGKGSTGGDRCTNGGNCP